MTKILVIDDTFDHLALFKTVLKVQNHEVAIAENKEVALPLFGFN